MEQNANAEDAPIIAAVAGISKVDGFLKSKSRVQFEPDSEVSIAADSVTTPNADPDPVTAITIKNTLTPKDFKNILLENRFVKFLTFHAGVLASNTPLDFHSHILLPKLKKLTVRIPNNDNISTQNPPIPLDFKRLFHFLKVVEYKELECVDIICTPDRAICIPLASAIIPCYEAEDSNPLMDLIRMNRRTIKSIAVGPAMNKFYLKLNPVDCTMICEDQSCVQQLEVFKGFPNYPTLNSWSKMLRPQKHLTKLYIAFNDLEVWGDASEAIRLSSDSLNTVKIKAFGTEPATMSLEVLKTCSRLTNFAIRYLGLELSGWESLPPSIKQITLAGPFTPVDTEKMAKTLTCIEEIFLVLKPVFVEEDKLGEPVNILQHSAFEFIKYAPTSLKEFNLDATDVILDLDPIKRWTELQTDFKLVVKSDSEFCLVRDSLKTEVVTSQAEEDSAEVEEDSPMCLGGVCFGWTSSSSQ